MVSRRLTLMAVVALIYLAITPAQATADLRVEPDRTALYENETLTVKVVGEMELSINFDMLFNLGSLELPAPDIEKLEENFEILGKNQKYSISTVNGKTQAEITWTYELAPVKTGDLTIPPLNFNGDRSEPVTIEVRGGNAPDSAAPARDAFIELAADKDEVYVQEQIVLTVRLFFAGNLIRGELSEPAHPDALIESLGNQKEFNRFIDGRRFRVVERRYAIYPQEQGQLSLEAIRFDGQTRDNNGQLRFVRDTAQLFDIPVKPAPDQFSGDTWLPAKELTLSDSGVPDQTTLDVGQSLTRTLTIKAEGLQAEALPPLSLTTPAGLRSYPENPDTSTEVDNQTVIGTLTQTMAIVGVEPGTVTLPEVRLPWWDTTADKERVAVIPARTVTVSAQGGTSDQPALSPEQVEPVERPEPAAAPDAQPEAYRGFWPWLAGALAVGWALTVVFMRKRAGRASEPAQDNGANAGEQALFARLCSAASHGEIAALDLFPKWLNAAQPGQNFSTVSEAVRWSGRPELKAQIDRLQAYHFSRSAQKASRWDGSGLVKELQALREQGNAKTGQSRLPPLYPESYRS
ncbi:BatD family protein [Marinobacter salicampi]|uniref:BatD family protein n=1 Tax=Marinobacter salicampi TaxID=435907 RepID=UPI001408371C|nr:BatD family protein [Marinobacter salicampi]